MRLLFEHGAEVGAKSKDGSVLALAAYYGHEDAVRFLASKGADVADRSALKFANRRGSDSTARILNGDQADAPKSPRSEVLKEMPAGGEMAGSPSRRRLKDILSTGPSHADHIARTRTSSMNTTVASSTPRTRIVQSLVTMATKCSPRQEKRWTTARRRTPLLH